MSPLFIGRPVYWGLLAAAVAVLAWFGLGAVHVRHFVPFHLVLLAITAAMVAAVVVLYRPGERITREPLEDESAPGD